MKRSSTAAWIGLLWCEGSWLLTTFGILEASFVSLDYWVTKEVFAFLVTCTSGITHLFIGGWFMLGYLVRVTAPLKVIKVEGVGTIGRNA